MAHAHRNSSLQSFASDVEVAHAKMSSTAVTDWLAKSSKHCDAKRASSATSPFSARATQPWLPGYGSFSPSFFSVFPLSKLLTGMSSSSGGNNSSSFGFEETVPMSERIGEESSSPPPKEL